MHDFELYGYSVFETLAARKGSFWRLDEHWERLSAAAAEFGLEAPSWPGFVHALLEHHDLSRDETLRYTLARQGGRWSGEPAASRFAVLSAPLNPDPAPVRLMLAEDRLPCDDPARCYKTGSRLIYQSRFCQAQEQGFHDVLFADAKDRLLETSTSNLLVLLDDSWLTPPLMSGLLPGIYRDWLLERNLIREQALTTDDLASCRAVAVTNAVRGIRPVVCLDEQTLSPAPVEQLAKQIGAQTWQPADFWLAREQ